LEYVEVRWLLAPGAVFPLLQALLDHPLPLPGNFLSIVFGFALLAFFKIDALSQAKVFPFQSSRAALAMMLRLKTLKNFLKTICSCATTTININRLSVYRLLLCFVGCLVTISSLQSRACCANAVSLCADQSYLLSVRAFTS
jgi:hypothetical protein